MSKRRKTRDEIILLKILDLHTEIVDAIKNYKISSTQVFAHSDPILKRGLIHAAGDMFELTKNLTDAIKSKVGVNNDFIKSFRNKVAHNYGAIAAVEAYAWVTHCASKDVKKNILSAIDEIIANETPKHGEQPSLRESNQS